MNVEAWAEKHNQQFVEWGGKQYTPACVPVEALKELCSGFLLFLWEKHEDKAGTGCLIGHYQTMAEAAEAAAPTLVTLGELGRAEIYDLSERISFHWKDLGWLTPKPAEEKPRQPASMEARNAEKAREIWKQRSEALGLKPKSATYQRAALEFFMGYHAAAPLPAMLLMCISVGRDPLTLR